MLLLIPHFNFALQVSLISEAKTDTDIWHTTGLEPKRCIQSNASAATREVWLWRKGWLSCLTFLRTFSFDRFNLLNANSVKKKKRQQRGSETLSNNCFRRERAMSRSRLAQRAAPAVFSSQQSPTQTLSPTPSPTSPLPTHVYYTPVMDEPLALIKKPRKETESAEEKNKGTSSSQIQVIQQSLSRTQGI